MRHRQGGHGVGWQQRLKHGWRRVYCGNTHKAQLLQLFELPFPQLLLNIEHFYIGRLNYYYNILCTFMNYIYKMFLPLKSATKNHFFKYNV